MKKNGVSALKVAGTYIGTIVGAGFATGQEILQFFTRFGINGLLGIVLATILFIVFGYIIMDLGKRLNARSHLEIIQYSGGKVLGEITDALITFFLFGSLTAMIAGTGALFKQQLALPSILGNVVMGVLTAVTVLTGIKGVINSISFVVPFLLISVIGVSVYSIINATPNFAASVQTADENILISNWLMSAILYVSYNTMISIAVLGPLGLEAQDKKAIRNGAVLGGVGLGLASVMIFLALCGNVSRISGLEVPMIYIAGGISPFAQILYAFVLIAEVYTTAVGALYGFASRIISVEKPSVKMFATVIGVTAAALIASQFGFSNMVKYLYPVEGIVGIVLLVNLVYMRFSNKKPG